YRRRRPCKQNLSTLANSEGRRRSKLDLKPTPSVTERRSHEAPVESQIVKVRNERGGEPAVKGEAEGGDGSHLVASLQEN
ncbi:hypothetical protein A2U01_0085787, partial [Trifolium medium]|nr:hypothetical protein [Trifolium medium]